MEAYSFLSLAGIRTRSWHENFGGREQAPRYGSGNISHSIFRLLRKQVIRATFLFLSTALRRHFRASFPFLYVLNLFSPSFSPSGAAPRLHISALLMMPMTSPHPFSLCNRCLRAFFSLSSYVPPLLEAQILASRPKS